MHRNKEAIVRTLLWEQYRILRRPALVMTLLVPAVLFVTLNTDLVDDLRDVQSQLLYVLLLIPFLTIYGGVDDIRFGIAPRYALVPAPRGLVVLTIVSCRVCCAALLLLLWVQSHMVFAGLTSLLPASWALPMMARMGLVHVAILFLLYLSMQIITVALSRLGTQQALLGMAAGLATLFYYHHGIIALFYRRAVGQSFLLLPEAWIFLAGCATATAGIIYAATRSREQRAPKLRSAGFGRKSRWFQAFSSPRAGLLWMEWRVHGHVMPVAAVAAMLVMYLPQAFSPYPLIDDYFVPEAIGVVVISSALVAGLRMAASNYFTQKRALGNYIFVRPVSDSQLIRARMIVVISTLLMVGIPCGVMRVILSNSLSQEFLLDTATMGAASWMAYWISVPLYPALMAGMIVGVPLLSMFMANAPFSPTISSETQAENMILFFGNEILILCVAALFLRTSRNKTNVLVLAFLLAYSSYVLWKQWQGNATFVSWSAFPILCLAPFAHLQHQVARRRHL